MPQGIDGFRPHGSGRLTDRIGERNTGPLFYAVPSSTTLRII